ncbi:hypothetical protein [Arthrobacter zhaoguopingii]|uniref:hypothetical protein n=1 Tax=Arthrobacter zhaoguopingii TaxID=2681491 RepID=UPI001AEF364D|nr:hypothetical protein [Arthrobacter zhaoguopingii]
MLIFIFAVSFSLNTHEIPPYIKRGSRTDRFFEHLVTVANYVVIVVGIIAPPWGSFSGPFLFSYAGAACVVGAQFVRGYAFPFEKARPPRGRHEKPLDEQLVVGGRWPYRVCYLLGYGLMGIYVFTL